MACDQSVTWDPLILLRRQRFQIGHQQVVLLQNQQMINAINQPRMESACRTS